MRTALEEASRFLESLIRGSERPADFAPTAAKVETLHAACSILSSEDLSTTSPDSVERLFAYIENTTTWPSGVFGGKAELLEQCGFTAWRANFRQSNSAEEAKWRRKYSKLSTFSRSVEAVRVLSPPFEGWPSPRELGVGDYQLILALLGHLQQGIESWPKKIAEQAPALFDILKSEASADGFEAEHQYLRGEFACLAGTAARKLGRRAEAHAWFQRAEVEFEAAPNREANLCRLAYQRLALRTDEWGVEGVIDQAEELGRRFGVMGLVEESLKCRLLAAISLKEGGESEKGRRLLEALASESRAHGFETLESIATANLLQIHSFNGDVAAAMGMSQRLIPMLQRLGNQIGIAKTQLGMGCLLKTHGTPKQSLDAFLMAASKFAELGMEADLVAVQLLIADVLIQAHRWKEAARYIRLALESIDELKLVPEGIAALSLLRESLRRRQIDRQALRSLNGYFEELQG